MPKLLIVDDEPLICQSFEWVFSKGDVQVISAGTVRDAWRRVEEDQPSVVVLDYQLPDGTGLELFDRIREAYPKRPVIFLTARGTTETAIEAMKRGAFDYLDKPFDLTQMSTLLRRAFEAAAQINDPPQYAEAFNNDLIIGKSPLIQAVCKHIGRVAPLDVTVLILGESGTGKELVAQAIHQHSNRAQKPFVAINCAAIPDGLVESELFGHEAGAYTGASTMRIGRFEQADGGTILLDEIGDMPAGVQAKVLRFLQDQTFERVGGRQSIRTQVRVLAATNQDLEKQIAAGTFRSDLYYRLKEITIQLPPLRNRAEDIPELANHFLRQFAREARLDIEGFSSDVLDMFRGLPWAGNVRELRGVVREAALRTRGRFVLAEFLPPGLMENGHHDKKLAPSNVGEIGELDLATLIDGLLNSTDNEVYQRAIRAVERELFIRTLRYTHGHLGQACERLGIDRKTLRNKLIDLKISQEKTVSDSGE
jgi:two-component system nitrogen regulation response regulator GlnG